MTTISARNPDSEGDGWAALVLLLSMPAVSAICVVSVQIYLGRGINPLTAAMVAALTLLIYALNGISDSAEDAINDATRAATLRANAWWTLGVSSLVMVAVGAFLLPRGQLHPLYLILMLIGFGYSFRVIPVVPSSRRRWLRLKDVPLVKNLTIGCTWTAAVFLAPLFDLKGVPNALGQFAVLGATFAFIAAENSIFCDLRDEVGDREAGVRTVVGLLGRSRTFGAIFAANIVWSLLVAATYSLDIIDAVMAFFLIALALGYPVCVWFATERFMVRPGVANGIIESSAVVFAIGLIALGSR